VFVNQNQDVLINVEIRNGLPFDMVIPDETTVKTFDETDSGRNLVVCEDADDMFKKLGI
jgi:DNA-damage-inducible protein J